MTNLLKILLGFLFCFMVGFCWTLLAFPLLLQKQPPYQTAREQLMALQGRVGCSKVDGVIGPETTTLVNQAVKDEERDLFDSFAEKFMTESGTPE